MDPERGGGWEGKEARGEGEWGFTLPVQLKALYQE